ncbi:MAG: hypothetical protein HWQ41_03830 [Nostoc sp. NOS(2021)]|uniref:hypothetical protein n=1 Tax=Nostoc sp. NOS(2021) TaxID=2815407 RepID=UPI0025DB3A9C|nr:hypothetical protein [Nostoc sp. NOS(2021)]MBN3894418.1 hypothetical protein [Nostoc sp. NOS(2021)]
MIQQQFEQLKKISSGFAYKDFEVAENKIVKKIYRYKGKDNPNAVVKTCHEFYVDGNQIIEEITETVCEFAIFSENKFVLPEGYCFGDPVRQEYKYYDNAVELAFRFGVEFENSHGKLHPLKWSSLAESVRELEYILLKGAGHNIAIRRADTAFFSFQNEHYLVTHSSAGYVLHKKGSAAQVSGEVMSTYKTAMDLILAVGIQKFQFGIGDNGGD